MSHSIFDAVEERNVVVSLEPGPRGTVRLSYGPPRFELPAQWLRGPLAGQRLAATYCPPVIEVDRQKLRALKLSQDELAEIGFALVLRLAGLLVALPGADPAA